jgi:hypothetical protein
MVVEQPERGVILKEWIGAGCIPIAKEEASEFCKLHCPWLGGILNQAGLEAPVLYALDHVLADAETDHGVIGKETARIVLYEPDTLFEPPVSGDKCLVSRKPKPLCGLRKLPMGNRTVVVCSFGRHSEEKGN